MSEGRPSLNATHNGMIHITIPVGILQCNCSIIGDPETREALVVDPGDEVTRILDLIGRYKLTVSAIVSTHAHIDHVGGLSKLHQYTGAPVLMHREDLPLYQAMDMQASFLGIMPPELTDIDQLLKEGDVLRWGSFEAQVIHTPGHTPGTLSLIFMVKDHGKPLTVAYSGGTAFNFPSTVANFDTYIKSQAKMAAAAAAANATILMSNHSEFDSAVPKIKMMAARKPGEPHPFDLGAEAVQRYFTVTSECAQAQRLKVMQLGK
jgi:metallo-beta-lactamase class B